MIDKQYIESAKTIRKEFINLTSSLNGYQDDVKELALFLNDKIEELKKYNLSLPKMKKTKEEAKKVVDHLINEIQSVEDAESKLTKKVELVNKKLEKLKRDEESLYKALKEKYPNLSDDDLRKEIHSHL